MWGRGETVVVVVALAILLSCGIANGKPVPVGVADSIRWKAEYAISVGEADDLIALLDSYPEKFSAPGVVDTLLMKATFWGNYFIVTELLNRGANIEIQGRWLCMTPLLTAASSLRPDTTLSDTLFYELLRRGADPFARDSEGATILHHAAKFGSLWKLKTILDLGLDPNTSNNNSQTALHYAASNNNHQAVSFLIDHSANIEAKDKAMQTPLQHAWNAEPRMSAIYIEGPDHYEQEEMRTWGAPESFETLVKANADLSAIDFMGNKSILKMAEYDNPALFEYALSRGAQLFDLSAETSALHISASFNCSKNVIFLLSKGLNPDITDCVGDTPLIVACRRGYLDIVKLLVEAGADINHTPICPPVKDPELWIVSYSRLTLLRPIRWALASKNIDIVRYLIQQGAETDYCEYGYDPPLISAIHMQDSILVQEFLDCGANPNGPDCSSDSPLERALCLNNISLVNLLLRAGARVDKVLQRSPEPPRRAPILHLLIHKRATESLGWLLEQGADTNERDNEGKTPLYLIVANDDSDLLSLFARHNADIHTVTNGESLLHVAARYGAENCLKLLLSYGLDPNIQGGNITPLGALCRYPVNHADSVAEANWLWKTNKMAVELMNAGADPQVVHWNATDRTFADGIADSSGTMREKRSLLQLALLYQNRALVELSLAKGIDPVGLGADKETNLHRVVQLIMGKPWMISLLVSYGLNPNCTDINGNTPLHLAAMQRTPWSVTALLEAGASPTVTNNEGLTPLDLAKRRNLPDIVQPLTKAMKGKK